MMDTNSGQIDRRAYLKTTGLATAGMVGLAGCTGDGDLNGADDGEETDDTEDNGDSFGTLSTSITDQPNDIGDFQELLVTIDGIWVLPATVDDEDGEDAEDDEEADDTDTENGDDGEDANGEDQDEEDTEDADEDNGDEEENGDEEDDADAEDAEQEADREGRRYIEFDEPQEADLVDLQGDNTQLIDETELEVGDYRYLQLNVSDTEGTLTDGETAEVETPGNAPLLFREEFEIRADEETRFIADFAPQRRGRDNSYIIRPVATGTKVLYGDEEYTVDDDETDDDDPNGDNGDGDDTNGEDANGDDQNGQPDDDS